MKVSDRAPRFATMWNGEPRAAGGPIPQLLRVNSSPGEGALGLRQRGDLRGQRAGVGGVARRSHHVVGDEVEQRLQIVAFHRSGGH